MILVFNSCVEDYFPQIDRYTELLVVDGKITDKPGPYTVRISRSSVVNNPEYKPVQGCIVTISDNLGNNEKLHETDSGLYLTNTNGIQGIIGRKYKIAIQLPNGEMYASAFEEMKSPVKLDSVYAEIDYKEDKDYDHPLEGYQFYLDTEASPLDSNYYLWDLEATFHYQSDYTIRWIYEGSLEWFVATDSLYNCWTTYTVNRVFTIKTDGLNPNAILAYPLHFENTQTRRLSVKYSLLVNQYTITENAYKFYNGIKENDDDGSLYDKQPVQIKGNVFNIKDPDEPVLGYFLTAGSDEKRIFVDRPTYPVNFYYSNCTLSEADFERYSQLWWMPDSEYPIFAIETPGGRRAVPHKDCVDCRERGGTITKPDFWTD